MRLRAWSHAIGFAAVLLSAQTRAQVPAAAPAATDAQAQGPNRPEQRDARGLAPGAPNSGGTLTTEQVYSLLDAFVMARAQGALRLNDAQWSSFFQRMMKLQNIQRAHRRQRMRVLLEIRQLIGPNAPAGTEDAAIAAKTKDLDDLEARMVQDEQKALTDIDQVLSIRQRAHFRVFLENMERQKLDLLLKARQRASAPVPPPASVGRLR